MSSSDYRQVQSLIQRIERHPTKYGAWEAVLKFNDLDISPFYEEIIGGLNSSDPFSRECFLEILVKHQDSEIIGELQTLFQHGKSKRTNLVTSLSRLRTESKLPDSFYESVEKQSKKSNRRELYNPLDLVDAIPNIIFPEENNDYANALIQKLYENPDFFTQITKEDIGLVHAMFYANHEELKNKEYRTSRMWDFDTGGNPVEPYGQPSVGPSSLTFIMDSFLKKIRDNQQIISEDKHPLQFIGEIFYHQNIIHPFSDCNGRTNFLLMDLFLLSNQLPYIKMLDDDLPKYYWTLNHSEPTQFVQFLGDLIQRE